MYILTVIALFVGEPEPTYFQQFTADEAECLAVADKLQEVFTLKEDDLQFTIVICNPLAQVGER